MHRLAILATIATTALFTVPVAYADIGAWGTYPGQHAADSPVIDSLTAFAVSDWAARGVTVPCDPVHVDLASDLTDYDGTASARAYVDPFENQCRIVILKQIAQPVVRHAGHTYRTWANRITARWQAADLCRTFEHEIGHLAGLALPIWNGWQWIDGHPAGFDVMSNKHPRIPQPCRRLARFMFPRPAHRHRRSRPDPAPSARR